jgi:hypothetical protein
MISLSTVSTRLLALVTLAILGSATLARAEDTATSGPVVSEYRNGVAGAWLPDDLLRDLVADHDAIEHVRAALSAQNAAAEALRAQVDALQQAGAARREAERQLNLSLEKCSQAKKQAEEELSAWTRSPYLHLAIGAAAGALVTSLIVSKR